MIAETPPTGRHMKPIPMPLQNGMRRSRGKAGSSRSASTHMLTAVKWAGTSSRGARRGA